jgi:alkylation response protein AidB-like acyl-CoA dehydrogenase
MALQTVEVAAPEPGLTPDDMVARAEALQPLLRERQAETEQRGVMSEDTHQRLVDAGFYRVVQPRRFGGYEFDLPTFFRVAVALARGCPSTGWCYTLSAGHVVPLSSAFSERAQRELFGATGHFEAPHRPDALGTARPADGGYVINGRWDYLSGVPFATHLMGGCHLLNADGSRREGADAVVLQVVVPRAQFTVLDDWGDMLGFRGSGSNTAVVEDAFIPEHHAVNYAALDRTRETPGTRLHGNPMFLGHIGAQYSGHVGSAVIGAARAAVDELEHVLRTKRINAPANPESAPFRSENLDAQRDFGRALTLVDAAEGLLQHAAELHMQYGRRWRADGTPYSAEDNLRLSAMVIHGNRLAVDAMELMLATMGTSPLRDGQRMQRYWRDVSVYVAHRVANMTDAASIVARLHFGLPPTSPPAQVGPVPRVI